MMDMEINANTSGVHRKCKRWTSLTSLTQSLGPPAPNEVGVRNLEIYYISKHVARSWSLVKLQHLQAERMFGKIGGSK